MSKAGRVKESSSVRSAGQPTVINQIKRPIFKNHRATSPYGVVPARWLLKKTLFVLSVCVRRDGLCTATMIPLLLVGIVKQGRSLVVVPARAVSSVCCLCSNCAAKRADFYSVTLDKSASCKWDQRLAQ